MATPKAKSIDKVAIFGYNDTDDRYEAVEQTADGILFIMNNNFVPNAYDYVILTYVAAGDGAGEIETAIYKTGGSGGTTVATLTLAYDGSDRLSTVTKT